MIFYDDVLLELVTALGAALFFANAFRPGPPRRRPPRRGQGSRRPQPPREPRAQAGRQATTGKLDQAPVTRSVVFMLFGLVVMVWGLASIFT